MERASRQISFDLPDFSSRGEEDGAHLKLQIATYLLSMIHFDRLRSEGWVPDILTEHSMGIYAALAASEAITFEEGLWITQSIGKVLEREEGASGGAMASIVGLAIEEVEKIIQDLNGFGLSIANYNGSMHYVLSGEEEGIEKAMGLALSRRAISATRLTFNVALHSSRLSAIREEIEELLKEIEVRSLRYPILNHWTVSPLRKEEVKEFLSIEIGKPVYWDRCVKMLIQEGVTQFIEVGHGTTLTKLIRWIDRNVEAFSAGGRIEAKAD
jgi:[acyl-carrier-protein] S-malonyltransferase